VSARGRCPQCKSGRQHASDCTQPGVKLAEALPTLSDAAFSLLWHAAADEVAQRRDRMARAVRKAPPAREIETIERARKLDVALPVPDRMVPPREQPPRPAHGLVPAPFPSIAADPRLPPGIEDDPECAFYEGPRGVCGGPCDEEPAILCTQETRGGKHAGLHYNREKKRTWPQAGAVVEPPRRHRKKEEEVEPCP
jgi:hypothetical protein